MPYRVRCSCHDFAVAMFNKVLFAMLTQMQLSYSIEILFVMLTRMQFQLSMKMQLTCLMQCTSTGHVGVQMLVSNGKCYVVAMSIEMQLPCLLKCKCHVYSTEVAMFNKCSCHVLCTVLPLGMLVWK